MQAKLTFTEQQYFLFGGYGSRLVFYLMDIWHEVDRQRL
jgi:hypothetical protein